MKKNILIFCSWLELDSNVGIFFREQAEIISDHYNPILVVFKPKPISKKKYIFYDIIAVKEKKSKEGLMVLEISYPHSELYWNKINGYFRNLTIKYLKNFLLSKNLEISFIHAQSLFDAGLWAFDYFNKYRTPYIITEHNQISFLNFDKDKGHLIKKVLYNAKVKLVVSNDKIRQFVANGLFFDFVNIGNLISNRFCFIETDDLITKRLITIGAYSLLKDHLTLLKALDIVDKNISKKIEFVWIGFDGWGGNHENQVKELLLNFQFKNIVVVLTPLLERDQVASYLQNSSLFLFSSLSEGMPVSVLEALASGLPVFTSNCGGVDEIINEENGKIYQIKDYQKLSELVLSFLNSQYCYDRKKISESIIERFGENAFKDKLLSVYNSVI